MRRPSKTLLPHDAGREEVCAFFGLGNDACARLEVFVDTLKHWNARINLMAASTLAHVWQRHVADALQLLPLIDESVKRVIDFGSGGGVPGLVLALAEPERRRYILVESSRRKCAFLRQVVQKTEIDVMIRCERIEQAVRDVPGKGTLIVARALAPLERLLALGAPLFERGAAGLFLKGRNVGEELARARRRWRFREELVPSVTDAKGYIVKIGEVQRG